MAAGHSHRHRQVSQKRALLPGMRLAEEVFAPVSHRQWVLTMPKRLRIFYRYDCRLLGKLCRLAYETIRDSLRQSCGAREEEPGYVGAITTFGNLKGRHSHVYAIVSEGLFKRDGFFIRVVQVDMERCTPAWRERVFDLLISYFGWYSNKKRGVRKKKQAAALWIMENSDISAASEKHSCRIGGCV
ncbi:MAG: hypothetical protein EHM72_11355 [Calditrichaeota bacterium]|nr:MAG: hypothetical protein EHM72_11355 [Calditrichota bacterium]